MLVVVDGAISEAAGATIPALDRAAWYGDAVFETFRTFGRKVLDLEARLARLEQSAERLRFAEFPTRDVIRNDLARAIAAYDRDDAYVRVSVSRGAAAGGLLPPEGLSPLRVVAIGALPSFPARYRTSGLVAVTARAALEPGGARAAGAKAACYVEPLLAAIEARTRGADDAIGLDREGIVLEATTSNVFVRHGEVLLTPPLALGILPGVTRAITLRLARTLSVQVRETAFSVHRLYDADEIFLTSSVRGLVPVTTLDGRPVGAGEVGPSFRALSEAYEREVASEAASVDATADSR